MNNIVIHKYDLVIGRNQLALPVGSRILDIHEQYALPRVWVEKPVTSKDMTAVAITLYATGEVIEPKDHTFISTVHLAGGSLVYHAYMEVIENANT